MTFSRKRASAAPEPASAAQSSANAQAGQAAPDFEALFQQHWTRLCGLLFRLVGDRAEAEDLALDAFYQLYRRPPGDDHNLGGWLYRVGTRLGFNALRNRQRRQRYEEQAGRQVLQEAHGLDPAQQVEKTQERQRVRAALAQMKPRSARLLLLRHSGLPYAEIAAALEIAPGSVGTLLARAEAEFEQEYRRQEEVDF
jgi:RNA polymerase sigma-70 factor (ECF subfamily)